MQKTKSKIFITVLALSLSFIVGVGAVLATTDTTIQENTVTSIELKMEGAEAEWDAEGYSPKGYKLVWSKNENPVYPSRSEDKYAYYSNPETDEGAITGETGETYFVRVCAYIGGACKLYSNEVKVTIEEAETVACYELYSPVCGVDGKTYTNKCFAGDVKIAYEGKCDTEPRMCTMEYAPVCGIDNETYSNKCQAGKMPIAYPGKCQDLDDCALFFDGCNNCFVRDGEIAGCTRKYCAPNAIQPPKCLKYEEDKEVVIPDNCITWFDGCNKCTVEDGELEACTEMFCYTQEEPKCLEYEKEEEKPEIPEGCISWFDGCNMCGVGENGLLMCTLMACSPEMMKEPECKKYKEGYGDEDEDEDEDEEVDDEEEKKKKVGFGKFCGGIAGIQCANGLICKLDGDYPDAGGKCTNRGQEKKEENNFKEKAEKLAGDKFQEMLKEMKQLRNQVKEQANKIKHLEGLMKNVSKISERMQNSINNFITYGVDENTKNLGEGERAAVLNSFKAAFKKLPETDTDLEDAIKIANGRWPSLKSEEAERKAKETFRQIYKRNANMDNPNDNAAVTIMSYGLRQKAQNRNLNSERQGIKTFKHIFGHNPSTTEEWNTMQAITYSGATR